MSATVNIHEAKTHLSRLIERAFAGEDVVIAKAGKPMVRLVKVEQAPVKRIPGGWLQLAALKDDATASAFTAADMAAWDRKFDDL